MRGEVLCRLAEVFRQGDDRKRSEAEDEKRRGMRVFDEKGKGGKDEKSGEDVAREGRHIILKKVYQLLISEFRSAR